jgi:FAD/FMN-containing dehydrogenase
VSQPATALLQELAQICGPAHVLKDGDLSAWESDWRKRSRGKALAVVRPDSATQVAQVVQSCARHGVSMVPQGGNTGLVVGSTPDDSGRQVVLSLQRMNRVLTIDKANLTVTVEAGCILQALQERAQQEGLLFPLSLAAEGSCTIGGNLATNAGGTQVLRYGNARELCLGLQVVTAQGEVWEGLSGLRKDNTGYDLRDLFIGSEGTLGVITAATLKLYPLPTAQLTAWAAVESMEKAVALLGLAQQQLSACLTGFEVMSQFALSLVVKHFPQLRVPFHDSSAYGVLLEHSDHESPEHARAMLERLLEQALEQGLVGDAVVAEKGGLTVQDRRDLCAGFQEAVADVLVEKSRRALEVYLALSPAVPVLAVAGGVAANAVIRAKLMALCAKMGVQFLAPPLALCTDNAAMIAWAGMERFRTGARDDAALVARPRWPLDQTAAPMIGSGKKGAKA